MGVRAVQARPCSTCLLTLGRYGARPTPTVQRCALFTGEYLPDSIANTCPTQLHLRRLAACICQFTWQ
jgi:hypothetical protein